MGKFLQTWKQMRWIDITRTIGWDNIDFPQDAPVEMERVMDQSRGDIGNLTRLSMSAHAGTHLDAPAHFLSEGVFLEEIPPERFILEARVVEITGEKITEEELRNHYLEAGEAVLFKTANNNLARDEFQLNYVTLEPSAAKYLAQKGVSMVGLDYFSVDAYRPLNERDTVSDLVPVHKILLQAGCLILEDVNLDGVEAGHYLLICLPIKFYRSDGAPCRSLLGVWADDTA